MFPLHLLLSPSSSLPIEPPFQAKTRLEPVMTRLSAPARVGSTARKARRAAWALTWLGPDSAIVPSVGMNVPEMGQ